ncbi:MAG TPA: ATPase [Candidatus Limousia pullorum]|uniref:ATPase n=1 Tax=Candidatus Limousia pullorum TaxID=2840860 RepID=A0A9D1LWP0_9FIRM|nr:ATPase [Acutalibacteraceae bacterium]HIU49419.1 ATPase [Candidatus Limousia pullorum]
MKVDGLITELRDIMETAKGMPFSGGKALVDTNNVLDIIEEIEQEFPQEFRQAKSIVADRNQIIADAKREAEEIIRAAEERKKAMVNQHEIIRLARQQANDIIADAKDKNAKMKVVTNKYVDDLLKKVDDSITGYYTDIKNVRQQIKSIQKTQE